MNAIISYRGALRYLDSFLNLERRADQDARRAYRLDRMELLLSLFDHPERSFASFHLAGSKGKGSTLSLIHI